MTAKKRNMTPAQEIKELRDLLEKAHKRYVCKDCKCETCKHNARWNLRRDAILGITI